MSLASYRLLAQLGAGQDGVSYRAQLGDEAGLVEVRILRGAAADAERWKAIRRRLRLAALLDHPSALALRQLDLDHEPPYLVLQWADGAGLVEALAERLPLPRTEAIERATELASVLTAAHRLGLAHGSLTPDSVRLAGPQGVMLDSTGVATGASATTSVLTADLAADVADLGSLIRWLLGNASGDTPLFKLIQEMQATNPADRPLMHEVHERLTALLCPVDMTCVVDDLAAQTVAAPTQFEAVLRRPAGADAPRQTIGRFRLLEKLGEGGMGAVYRAEDPTDGTIVAIKVLRAQLVDNPQALRRFLKEARLLAEVNNPYVTNLLEVNEDDGIPYLAVEYVAGQTLSAYLDEQGALEEATALAILADVCRALVDAHQRGIVHRDIKPENILLKKQEGENLKDAAGSPSAFQVKLADFGLARHVVESESLHVTRTGAILGTPLYMAPEQCSGSGAIDPRTDVYALGATLFHLLAGRPPFLAETPLALIGLHCNEPAPPVRKFNPRVSDGAAQIVDRALAKLPELRHADADALLRDIERLRRGEPASMVVHPRLPACDPARVLHYDWSWELEASPEQLWPHVSNTERFNRAVHLPAVQYTTRTDEQGRVSRFGSLRKMGLLAAWQEHPFEWVEARRFGVLREYEQGPFRWLVSVVELTPRQGGGTTLTHRVRLEPAGLLGRTAAAVEVGIKGRRAVERVYRRIDAAVTGKLGGPLVSDPFEESAAPSRNQRRRLDALLDRLSARGLDATVLEHLATFLTNAPPQEVARIRPLALARRLQLDPDQVVSACLHGAREGLLVLLWDLLCPVCRIPSEVKDTLRALREHGHCEACNLDYQLDFAGSVEMIFRVHPEVRTAELGTYCIGGPVHSPHVAAQVRVAPGERVELALALAAGAYRLRGPQLPYAFEFHIETGAPAGRWELSLAHPQASALPPVLRAGGQVLALTNDHSAELVVRVERTAARDDALTAARASSLALFRELFPGEVLAPGQLVSVANVILLVTDLDQAGNFYEALGDARAFALLHEHFRLLDEHIRRAGGALVKTVGEGIVAAFHEPLAAVRAGLDLQGLLTGNPGTRELRLRVAIHRGPALAATLNDHLDYFGTTVSQAAHLLRWVRGGEVVLTHAVCSDPQVSALLQGRGMEGKIEQVNLPGRPEAIIQRFALADRP